MSAEMPRERQETVVGWPVGGLVGLGFRKDGRSSVPFLASISTSFSLLLLPKPRAPQLSRNVASVPAPSASVAISALVPPVLNCFVDYKYRIQKSLNILKHLSSFIVCLHRKKSIRYEPCPAAPVSRVPAPVPVPQQTGGSLPSAEPAPGPTGCFPEAILF